MVTRSSLVWVMTGIAAGIAAGWFWNRERTVELDRPAAVSRTEPIRSPFATARRAERTVDLGEHRADRSREGEAAAARTATQAPAGFSHRETLYTTASQADRSVLDSMIADARKLPGATQRRETLEVLLLRYAEIDVEGALGYAIDTDRQTAAQLLATLATVEPERAWARAAQVTNPAERFAYLDAVISTWAADDPQRAFAKVTELPADWQRSELLEQATGEIALRDPRLAIELAGTMEPTAAAALLDLVASVWSRNDPSAAARWVESNPRAQQGRLAYRIADAYVAQKPSEALAWALRISTSTRRYLWAHMLGKMAAYNPYEALQLAQAAESPAQRTQALGSVLGAIARTDPALAMSHLVKIPGGDTRFNIIGQIASSIAATTPAAALEWLNGIEDRRIQMEAAQALGDSLSRRDVEGAAQLVDRIPKEARPGWIRSVALAYADADFDKGRQWVRRHADEHGDAAFQFARAVAARSPELAVQLVEDVADDAERDRLLAGLLPPLAEHSPETAARWAERMTSAEGRVRAMAEVAGIWAQYDAAGARKWALSLDDGPGRDQALTALVMRSGAPLDDTLPIINQIGAPERRMHAVLMTAMRMSRTDPEGARTLLRRYPLDPQRQRQLDEYVQRARVVN